MGKAPDKQIYGEGPKRISKVEVNGDCALNKLKQAKQIVERIKSFYNHVVAFVLISGSLFLLKDKMTIAIFGDEALVDTRLMHWVDVNVYLWIGILLIHAIFVFGAVQSFVKKWEEQQV